MAKHSQLKDSGYWSNVINHQDLTLCCLYKIRLNINMNSLTFIKILKAFISPKNQKVSGISSKNWKAVKEKGSSNSYKYQEWLW